MLQRKTVAVYNENHPVHIHVNILRKHNAELMVVRAGCTHCRHQLVLRCFPPKFTITCLCTAKRALRTALLVLRHQETRSEQQTFQNELMKLMNLYTPDLFIIPATWTLTAFSKVQSIAFVMKTTHTYIILQIKVNTSMSFIISSGDLSWSRIDCEKVNPRAFCRHPWTGVGLPLGFYLPKSTLHEKDGDTDSASWGIRTAIPVFHTSKITSLVSYKTYCIDRIWNCAPVLKHVIKTWSGRKLHAFN